MKTILHGKNNILNRPQLTFGEGDNVKTIMFFHIGSIVAPAFFGSFIVVGLLATYCVVTASGKCILNLGKLALQKIEIGRGQLENT